MRGCQHVLVFMNLSVIGRLSPCEAPLVFSFIFHSDAGKWAGPTLRLQSDWLPDRLSLSQWDPR